MQIAISASITRQDFERLNAQFRAAHNASVKIEPVPGGVELRRFAEFLLENLPAELAFIALADLVELDEFPEDLLSTVFSRGDTGCRVAICLRNNLPAEVVRQCEHSNDPNVREHYSLKR